MMTGCVSLSLSTCQVYQSKALYNLYPHTHTHTHWDTTRASLLLHSPLSSYTARETDPIFVISYRRCCCCCCWPLIDRIGLFIPCIAYGIKKMRERERKKIEASHQWHCQRGMGRGRLSSWKTAIDAYLIEMIIKMWIEEQIHTDRGGCDSFTALGF